MKNKLIFLLILLLSSAAMVSCFEDNVHPCGGVITDDLVLNGDDGIHTDFEGVYLTLGSLGETSISVTWHNDTDKEAVYGESYSIERLVEGEWVSVLLNDTIAFEAIGIILMPHSESKKAYSTAPFDLSELGRYRLRCEFFPGEGTCNTWVEFEVAEKAEGDVNRIPDADITTFTEFLDREGFVPGMSQGNLLGLSEKYSEGLDESQIPAFYHYDGPYGGGCRGGGEIFGFTNDYHAEKGKVRYENSLYTKAELKNLSLPYGITFGDSIGDALEKMGIDRDIYKNTVISHSTDAYDINLTLYSQDGVTLVLTNWALSQAPVETLYHFVLTYTETADTDRKDGKVTRTVTLSFLDSENKLGMVEMKVVENYRN